MKIHEWSTDSYYNLDELWKPYTKRKTPDRNGRILYDSICMKCPEWVNPLTEKRLMVAKDCVVGAWGDGKWLLMVWVSFGGDEKLLELESGDGQNHWTMYTLEGKFYGMRIISQLLKHMKFRFRLRILSNQIINWKKKCFLSSHTAPASCGPWRTPLRAADAACAHPQAAFAFTNGRNGSGGSWQVLTGGFLKCRCRRL